MISSTHRPGILESVREDLTALLTTFNLAPLGFALVVGTVLLGLGLLARAGALLLLVVLFATHSHMRLTDADLCIAALLISYCAFGVRQLSFDALIAPGLNDSAFPTVGRIIGAVERFTEIASPALQLIYRFWLGAALIRVAPFNDVLPNDMVEHLLPHLLSVVGGAAIALGAGAAIANKILIFAAFGMQLMGSDINPLWLSLVLAQIGVIGEGRWSLDVVLSTRMRQWVKPSHGKTNTDDWPKVVIVGAGFGGMACAMQLRHLPVNITLIDRQNFHLFQPLLYQVATAGLSPADIAFPIRSRFRDDLNLRVIMDTVVGVDKTRRTVTVLSGEVPYDFLVLATGATHSYFGRDTWARFAPGLKRVEDATAIRAQLLTAFERAENQADRSEREAWLTFVIVGGGSTGVELAGALAELARFGLKHEYRAIDPGAARIILMHSGARLLPAFPDQLSARALVSLQKLGVSVLLNSRVESISEDKVFVGETSIAARTILWAAGVVASPAALWLDVKSDAAGRVVVDERLRVPGFPEIFVIGDTASCNAWRGRAVPGLAPAAKQAGAYAAKVIRSGLEMRMEPQPFSYRHWGNLATIGRKSAVADFGWIKLWGAPAWWMWGFVHVLFLANLRNRLSVIVAWVWAYITFRSSSRLITRPER
jgi:NADH dehydrogenase/putative oxidoreductase